MHQFRRATRSGADRPAAVRRRPWLRLERLESREVPSASLVKDINVGVNGSEPGGPMVVAGDYLYFSAYDPTNGRELWKTDGTTAGTTLVKDIHPGGNSSSPVSLTAVGSTLYFVADDGTHGTELWKTDGTAAGTVRVTDINAAGGSFTAGFELVAVASDLYFTADPGDGAVNLYKASSASVVTLVKDYSATLRPSELTAFKGALYFATNGDAAALLTSDGTFAGTVAVKILGSEVEGASVSSLSASPNLLFFTGSTDETTGMDSDHEPWVSDGTSAGTYELDVNPDVPGEPRSSRPGSKAYGLGVNTGIVYYLVGDIAYFTGFSETLGEGLFRSDGTIAGTLLVTNSGGISGHPVAADTRVFFPVGSSQIWATDVTGTSSYKVADVMIPANAVAVGDDLYFAALGFPTGTELWVSDGTLSGTTSLTDINPGFNGSNPSNLAGYSGSVYFRANDGTSGPELWKYALSSGGGGGGAGGGESGWSAAALLPESGGSVQSAARSSSQTSRQPATRSTQFTPEVSAPIQRSASGPTQARNDELAAAAEGLTVDTLELLGIEVLF